MTTDIYTYDTMVTVSGGMSDEVDNYDYAIAFDLAHTNVQAELRAEQIKISGITTEDNLVSEGLNGTKTMYTSTYVSGDDEIMIAVRGTGLGKIFGEDVSTGTASITAITFEYPNDLVHFGLSTAGTGLVYNFSTGQFTGKLTGVDFITPWLEVQGKGTIDASSLNVQNLDTNFAFNAKFTELSVAYPQDDYKVALKGSINYSQDSAGFAKFGGSLTEFSVETPESTLSYKGNLTYKGDSSGEQIFSGSVTEITISGDDSNFVFKGNIQFSTDGKLSGVVTDVTLNANGNIYDATGLNANILLLFNADGTAKDLNLDGVTNDADLKAFILAGNDYITSGINSDDLMGGAGADTFAITYNPAAPDIITDYNAEEGDVIDLTKIFTDSPSSSYNIIDSSFGDILQVTLQIDTAGGVNFVDIVHLQNVSLDDALTIITQGPNYVLAPELSANVANVLVGTANVDVLNGGIGADKMTGGADSDVYIVDNAKDVVVELAEGGEADEVRSSVSYTLGQFVENLTLRGNGLTNIKGTGNGLNNIIIGDIGNNSLDGGIGNDTLKGGAGDDVYVVNTAGDVVTEFEGQGTDTVRVSFVPEGPYVLGENIENAILVAPAALSLVGNGLNNHLIGNSKNNELFGEDGDDTLDGGLGNDILHGGLGDDTFIINSLSDAIIEEEDAGTDTVSATFAIDLNFIAFEHIENVTLLGSANISATGNDNANVLIGNAGANILDGGAGADKLIGGKGNDTYIIDDFNDEVIETGLAGSGIDSIKSGVSYDLSMRNNIEKLTLTGTDDNFAIGNTSANTLTGNAGSNYIDGGAGADTLIGGAGNDVYVVNLKVIGTGGATTVALQDKIIEVNTSAGGESDALILNGEAKLTKATTLTLVAGLEVLNASATGDTWLNLTGNAAGNFLAGNEANNLLKGLGGADTLFGGFGNDTLDGGAGNDDLDGGFGDDTYYIDLIAVKEGVVTFAMITDVAFDIEGNDSLIFRGAIKNTNYQDFSLLNNENFSSFENVDFSSTGTAKINIEGNGLDNQLVGNAAANSIVGGDGNDILIGGAGIDTLDGGFGDDIYIIDNINDVVIDEDGIDTLYSTVTIGLNKAEFNDALENLTLIGAAAINGTGNNDSNVITGNSAANVLTGLDGLDFLTGGLGADRFDFNNISESSVGFADVILDFSRAEKDKIDLSTIDAIANTEANDKFVFIADAEFTEIAGQLRFIDGFVSGDVDGDGFADFEIEVSGVVTLLATDFVL